MKKGWDKYANESRYIKKGYLRKYRNGSESGEARKTSGSDSVQCSGEIKEKIDIEVKIGIYATVENFDTTQQPQDDEGVVQSIVDVPVVSRKQVRRRRKTTDNQGNA